VIDPKPATGRTPQRRFGGTVAQIRSALGFYRVMAYATGSMLLLLCVEMSLRYGFGKFLFAGGSDAFTGKAFGFGLADADPAGVVGGVNLSITILIVHGWMYVLYLISNFRLWSLMRWPFMRLILMALGGVVPLLSFIVERRMHAEVERGLVAHPDAGQRY
jgi:integral membrane protein